MKSFEPINKRLSTDTWYYAKRCFLSLVEKMAKHMIIVSDKIVVEILDFLESCETHGKKIRSNLDPVIDGTDTYVTEEARILKRIFIKLRD